jgi:hypothetical protein
LVTASRRRRSAAAGNDADVAANLAPSLKKMMQRAPQDDSARSYVATCASWIDTLTAYFKRFKASEKDPQLRAIDDGLQALRLNLATRYPAAISP